jgi:hypothetical protein
LRLEHDTKTPEAKCLGSFYFFSVPARAKVLVLATSVAGDPVTCALFWPSDVAQAGG